MNERIEVACAPRLHRLIGLVAICTGMFFYMQLFTSAPQAAEAIVLSTLASI